MPIDSSAIIEHESASLPLLNAVTRQCNCGLHRDSEALRKVKGLFLTSMALGIYLGDLLAGLFRVYLDVRGGDAQYVVVEDSNSREETPPCT